MLHSAAHWSAVSHAVRIEICEFLAATGPLSIVDLARNVRKPADALYHHVKKLQAAGLVVVAKTRVTGKTSEALFDVVADYFVPDFDPKSGRNLDGVVGMLSASTTVAKDLSVHSLQNPSPDHRGSSMFGLEVTHLTEGDLARIKELLAEVRTLVAKGRTSRKGQLYAVSLLLMPIYSALFARRDELEKTPKRAGPRDANRTRPRARSHAG